MNQIKTFEEACERLGIKPVLPDVFAIDNQYGKTLLAHYKLMIIIEALNEGWLPDWENDDEEKYYPWFYMEDGFSLYDVHYDYGYSTVGSRLCFKSEALAKYAATQFLDLYKDLYTL